MLQQRAFRPVANSQSTAVTATSQTVILNNTNGTRAIRILIEGTETVYVAFGQGSPVTALADGTHMAILENTVEVFTIGREVDRISFIAGVAGSTIRTTIGEGL